MKKIIVSFISGFIILTSLCGCSEKDAVVNQKVVQTESNVTTQPTTTEPTLTTVSNTYTITLTRKFLTDLAWINVQSNKTENYYHMAIDKDGKVLAKLDINDNSNNDSDYAANVIVGETGGITATPQTHDFDTVLAYGDGYAFVCKAITGLDSNEYHFGVIKRNGEWEKPLEPIPERKFSARQGTNTTIVPPEVIYAGDGVFQIDKSAFYSTISHDWFSVPSVDKLVTFNDGYAVAKANNNTVIQSNGNYYEYPIKGDLCTYSDGVVFNTSDCKCYNINGDIVLDLERYKEYHLSRVIFDNGYSVIELRGIDGQSYYTVIDKSGNEMFEPRVHQISGQAGVTSLTDMQAGYFCVLSETNTRQVVDINGNVIRDISAKASNDFYSGYLCENANYRDAQGRYLFENNIIIED